MNTMNPKKSQTQRSHHLGLLKAIATLLALALMGALGGCMGEPFEAESSQPSDQSNPGAQTQFKSQSPTYAQAIKGTFRRGRQGLKGCYDLARKGQPNLNTKIVLKLSLSPDGQVTAPSIVSATVDSKILERCLIDTVSKWSFPHHPRGEKAVVTYPLTFSTAESSAARNSSESQTGSSDSVSALSKGDIRRVWNQAKKTFLKCYEPALKENPSLAGRIKVDFTIAENGSVSRAKAVQVALKDEAVVKCVVDHVATLTFPKPSKGGVEVSMPLTFTP